MTITAALTAQLHALEAQAQADGVPGGLLAWWGLSKFPDGTREVYPLTERTWESVYAALQQAALTPGVVQPLFALKARSAAQRPDNALRVAIVNFQVAMPTAAFRRRVMKAAQAGVALDPPLGAPASITSMSRVFAAFGLVMQEQWGRREPVIRDRRASFWLDPAFYFTNPGAERPGLVELDCGDGRGPRRLSFGDTVDAQYEAAGVITAEISCRFGGTTLRSRFRVNVEDGAAAPAPDETWPLAGASGNKGKAYVFRAHGRDVVTNPVIISEGFPGGYSAEYLYDMINQHGAAEALRTGGYDLVLIGYANGLDRIENNAHVAIACIRAAMRRTSNPLVVGGVSMGGLITRYALALMEAMDWEHQTRLYLSIDTPHRGSYTNLCAQWFAQYFATSSPAAALQAGALASPANQQFLAAWLHQGVVQESPLRQAFLDSLEKLGAYPQKPRRIAIASGRGDGERSHAPYQRALSWTGNPFIGAELWTLPEGPAAEVVARGYSYKAGADVPDTLRFQSDVSWEGAPGGQNVYNQVAHEIATDLGCGGPASALWPTCSVPTVSALDIAVSPFERVPPPGSSASPFHDYICCETNQHHVQFTPAVKGWLVRQVDIALASNPGEPTVEFDPTAFDPHDSRFLADPYPTYALFRQHAPVCMVQPYKSYWVFRAGDVRRVLDDEDAFLKNPSEPPGAARDMPPTALQIAKFMPKGIFVADPPRHGELREILEPLFQTAITDAEDVAEKESQRLLANARGTHRLELLSAYAEPLPAHILLTIFGIPQQHHQGIVGWVTGMLAGHDITTALSWQKMAGTCALALGGYLQALQRGCPIKGLEDRMFELMVSNIGQTPRMSAEEVQQTSINFALAGYLSTKSLIANGTFTLINNPEQLTLLRKDPELMPGAIEEMLRYDAPAQLVDRYASRDVELGGVKLKKNDKVTAVLGSANRDPEAFRDPDVFTITRKGAHVAFGAGIHECIGAPLARTTAPVAFRVLLDTFTDLAIDGLPQWQTDPYLRSPVNLPLAVSS